MALPFQNLDTKFKTTDGKFVTKKVPSYDDYDHNWYGIIVEEGPGTHSNDGPTGNFNQDYENGRSLEGGLSGQAETLRSFGPSGENQLRSYHDNQSKNDKREKREAATRRIRSR